MKKRLFIPKSLKRGSTLPHEVLFSCIVLMAAWPEERKEKKTKTFVTPTGAKIPPHYHWGVLRDCVSRLGVKVGEIITNLHAFCNVSLFGKGREGDVVAVRCTVEQKVKDQAIFHPVIEGVKDFLGCGKNRDLAGDPAALHFALMCMRAILVRWPEMRDEDGRLLQEVFGDFINPRFRTDRDDFISDEEWTQLQADPAYLEDFLSRLEECTFQATFNPISFSGVSREELTEAVRRGEVYELKTQADQREFARLQEQAVFSVRQEKHFGLHFTDSGKYADEQGYTLRPDYCRDRLTGWRVACNPHPVLIAAVSLPEKRLNGLRKLLKVEVLPSTASDSSSVDPAGNAQAQA
jgi:hypothetical protein